MDSDDKAIILLMLAEIYGWPYKVTMTDTSVNVEWL